MSRGGAQAGDPHGDPSCLLTPPGTPLSLEPAVPDWPEASSACGEVLLEGRRNGPSGPGCAAPQGEPRARPAPQSWPCWRLGNCLGVLPLRGPGVASGPGCQSCPRTPVALDTGQAPGAAGEGTAWLRPGQLGTRGVTPPGGEEGWPHEVCWAPEPMRGQRDWWGAGRGSGALGVWALGWPGWRATKGKHPPAPPGSGESSVLAPSLEGALRAGVTGTELGLRQDTSQRPGWCPGRAPRLTLWGERGRRTLSVGSSKAQLKRAPAPEGQTWGHR